MKRKTTLEYYVVIYGGVLLGKASMCVLYFATLGLATAQGQGWAHALLVLPRGTSQLSVAEDVAEGCGNAAGARSQA